VKDLLKKLNCKKEALKNAAQAIVASLEGMKIRKDRSLLFLHILSQKC
jgi:hypothetical protein